MRYTVWTDGSCKGNPGPGSLAFIVISHDENDQQHSYAEGYKFTTNNRMELLSIIKAIEFLQDKNPEFILIKSDSQYSINIFSTWLLNWSPAFTGKKNIDLLKRASILLEKHKNILKFEWIRGHDGNLMNEECDILAKKQYNNPQNMLIDENYISK